MLKKFSLLVRRAEPDGAYTFISFRPLYSADMARPDGSLWTFVIGIAFLYCSPTHRGPDVVMNFISPKVQLVRVCNFLEEQYVYFMSMYVVG